MSQDPIILGEAKIDIDGFTFGEKSLQMNPARLTMLLLCIDPTEKQKEIFKKLNVILYDDFGKQYYPREEENKPEDGEKKGG